MANTQAPFGFRPLRRNDAAAPTYAMETRQVLSTDTTAIGYGDVVKALATGYVARATAADNAIAAPGIFGIFYGCEYYDTALQRKLWMPNWTGVATALAGSILAKICVDPMMLFEVQNGNSTAITIADLGANIGIFNGTVASNGLSTQAVDQATLNVTATLPFQIRALSANIGNDNTSGFNTVVVALNNQAYRSTTGI